MSNTFLKKQKKIIGYDYALLKTKFLERDFFFLVPLILLFVFFALSLTLPHKPFNIVYNVCFGLFCLSLIPLFIKRKKIVFSWFYAFWFLYFAVVLIINSYKNTISLTPFIDILSAISIFFFLSQCNKKEVRIILKMIYLALCVFLLAIICVYGIEIIQTFSYRPFLNNIFGNLDGISLHLFFLVLFACFYSQENNLLSFLISLLSFLIIIITARRTAAFLSILAFVVLFVVYFSRKGKKILIIASVVAVVIIIPICFLPFVRETIGRFLNILNISNGVANEGSAYERISMIIRGFYYANSNLFTGHGYNGVVPFVSQPNHDTFGDLAFAYGGFIAILISILLFFAFLYLMTKNSKYNFLTKILGVSALILFFFTAFFQMRSFCFLSGLLFGLAINENDGMEKYLREICDFEYLDIII